MSKRFHSDKSVGVVCSTYRDPDKDNLVRLYGSVTLFDQMLHQTYPGQVRIAIVDDSPEPHPFFQSLGRQFDDRLIYLHVPSRDQALQNLQQYNSDLAQFIPDNAQLQKAVHASLVGRTNTNMLAAELKLASGNFNLSQEEWDEIIGKRSTESRIASNEICEKIFYPIKEISDYTNFWKKRYEEAKSIAYLSPWEEGYPVSPNLLKDIFQVRPTIGMKKNLGIQALDSKFGDIDIIVFADDDDQHSNDYVRQSVGALGDADFTRMTRYFMHHFDRDLSNQRWGLFDLPLQEDRLGNWLVKEPPPFREVFNRAPDGTIFSEPVSKKFSKLIAMAVPINAYDGAVHTYRFDTWKESVGLFGGIIPISVGEDVFYMRSLKSELGRKINATTASPESPSFIRVADGLNQSIPYWMKNLEISELPKWAEQALKPLYRAAKIANSGHTELLRELGRTYSDKGIQLSIFDNPKWLFGNPHSHAPGFNL